MTTVAEEGNRRVGDMTEDEMEQCAGGYFNIIVCAIIASTCPADIKAWFERKSDISATGVRSSDFQSLEKGIDATIPEVCSSTLDQLSLALISKIVI